MSRFAAARALLDAAAAARAFPAAAVEVGRRDAVLWREALGRLTYEPDAPPATGDTIFDLASLTKVIATTPRWMQLVRDGRLGFDDEIASWAPGWRGSDRRDVRLTQLLDHSSGLPAHRRLFEQTRDRAGFETAICSTPVAYPPGTAAVYSDLGFILLGLVLERADGVPLDAQFMTIAARLGAPVAFTPPEAWRPRIAPTERDPWRGRLLVGEVHDENAAALGGVAGHAGLFGTAAAVGAFARVVLETFQRETWLATPALLRAVAARTGVPGSSRALGWDTMRPTSSCGARMSATAIGHTGFTGTSLWIDWERDVYVVLLTNRVYPTRENDALPKLRPAFHDAVMDGLGAR